MESKCKKCMNGYPSVECVNCEQNFGTISPIALPPTPTASVK